MYCSLGTKGYRPAAFVLNDMMKYLAYIWLRFAGAQSLEFPDQVALIIRVKSKTSRIPDTDSGDAQSKVT